MRRKACSAPRTIVVRALSARASSGRAALGGLVVPCALGRSGGRFLKREGDGASPRGTWTLERIAYRADRGGRPRSLLPASPIRPADGWCDEPGDRNYNRPVRHPYPASAERLWREDGLYDLIVVLSHNRRPRVRNAGSAVFMHVARPGLAPTEGCIALSRPHLQRLLQYLGRGARIRIV